MSDNKGWSVTADKWLVGLLGLGLFATLLTVGFEDAKRQSEVRHEQQARMDALAKAMQNPRVAAGRKVFEKFGCYACHGSDAKGGTPNYNAQTGEQVPGLTKVADSYTKEELRNKILKGVPNVQKKNPDGPKPPLYMPTFNGIIHDEDMGPLVDYLMSLEPKSEKDSW